MKRALCLVPLLLMTACGQQQPAELGVATAIKESRQVYRGKLSDLVFCGGDDGLIEIVNGRLKVDCADRRNVPVALSGAAELGNLELDCDAWCPSLVKANQGPVVLRDLVFRENRLRHR